MPKKAAPMRVTFRILFFKKLSLIKDALFVIIEAAKKLKKGNA
jgi:hypothetical protein